MFIWILHSGVFHSNLGLFDTNIEGAADKAHFSLILPEVVHRAGVTHIETHSSFPVRGDSFAFKGKLKGRYRCGRPWFEKKARLHSRSLGCWGEGMWDIPKTPSLVLTITLAFSRPFCCFYSFDWCVGMCDFFFLSFRVWTLCRGRVHLYDVNRISRVHYHQTAAYKNTASQHERKP